MRILITGGAGFIGSHLAEYHLQKKDEVIVVDDFSTSKVQNILPLFKNKNFTFYQNNLADWDELGNVVASVERVYHLAAMVGIFNVIDNPVRTLRVNIDCTLKLYEMIHEQSVKPLILVASSSEVYGNQSGRIKETAPLIIADSSKNQASYAISKLCEESIALSYHDSWKLPCIILRLFNTIGINQSSKYGMVVPRLIKQALANEDITIFGEGTQKRAFCDVRDLVNLMDLIAQCEEVVGQVVNIGNDRAVSINTLAKLIKKLAKSDSNIVKIPIEDAYSNKDMFIKDRRPNLSKLLGFTHYKYQWPLEKTIKELIQFEKNNASSK